MERGDRYVQTLASTRMDNLLENDSQSTTVSEQQVLVHKHFTEAAFYWKQVYADRDVYAVIHQQRRSALFSMIDELCLAPGSDVLDVGCGAGLISVGLASRGFITKAVDPTQAMIELTERAALEAGVSDSVSATVGDIHRLDFPDNTFKLVLAIGVLPWLQDYHRALNELARVLEPGGYLIANVDNRWALHRILDPSANAITAPLIRGVGRTLRALHLRRPRSGVTTTTASRRTFNNLLRHYGLETVETAMFGFGPFRIVGQRYLAFSTGVQCHRFLQELCDRNIPILRSMGAQYLVTAKKPLQGI